MLKANDFEETKSKKSLQIGFKRTLRAQFI